MTSCLEFYLQLRNTIGGTFVKNARMKSQRPLSLFSNIVVVEVGSCKNI